MTVQAARRNGVRITFEQERTTLVKFQAIPSPGGGTDTQIAYHTELYLPGAFLVSCMYIVAILDAWEKEEVVLEEIKQLREDLAQMINYPPFPIH